MENVKSHNSWLEWVNNGTPKWDTSCCTSRYIDRSWSATVVGKWLRLYSLCEVAITQFYQTMQPSLCTSVQVQRSYTNADNLILWKLKGCHHGTDDATYISTSLVSGNCPQLGMLSCVKPVSANQHKLRGIVAIKGGDSAEPSLHVYTPNTRSHSTHAWYHTSCSKMDMWPPYHFLHAWVLLLVK